MKNIYEIFDELAKATTKQEKIDILRANDNFALRNILKGTYAPYIQFVFETAPPYKPSDSPPGLGYTSIHQELDRAYLFEKDNPRVSPQLTQRRKEEILIGILEALEAKESEIYMNMILKKQNVPGLTKKIVLEAFPGLF